MRDALPQHQVTVDGFWMDVAEATNGQFQAFVDATGYRTLAERPLAPVEFPGVPTENLLAGSVVFNAPEPVHPRFRDEKIPRFGPSVEPAVGTLLDGVYLGNIFVVITEFFGRIWACKIASARGGSRARV